MRVEEINERSVLLARQSSALTFLLNKFKNTKRSFGYHLCKVESLTFLLNKLNLKTQNAALATVCAKNSSGVLAVPTPPFLTINFVTVDSTSSSSPARNFI
jgi:hypothetical protein